MAKISQLERARKAIKQSEMTSSRRVDFSVSDFSKESVERLIIAMDEVRSSELKES